MDYQASGVTFPAPGCWEVEARAASSVLDFVVYVYALGNRRGEEPAFLGLQESQGGQ